MKTINRNDYPELNKLLWDIHTTKVAPEVAYQLYEQRWQFVDQDNLIKRERELLDTLQKTVGKGLFMPVND